MNRSTATRHRLIPLGGLAGITLALLASGSALVTVASATAPAQDALQRRTSWQVYDTAEMAAMLRSSLEELGVSPAERDRASEEFVTSIQQREVDPLTAYVQSVRPLVPIVDELLTKSETTLTGAAASIDPNTAGYVAMESLPKSLRMTTRSWLGRELVRRRLYDEALPVIAEVDPSQSISPATVLFYRGACYHALLMKEGALSDLRQLLENEQACPDRYVRTAQLMIADIKPLKEDSLDEISRLMTDVTRRLDLGRANEEVQEREQQIIDKLSKLIDKIEQQQQQQQQQNQQQADGQGSRQAGSATPMDDSRIAGANGQGDVERKQIDQRNGWGNLPPAERQQTLQQISRDLPTHYREAIEAYFRKLATDGNDAG